MTDVVEFNTTRKCMKSTPWALYTISGLTLLLLKSAVALLSFFMLQHLALMRLETRAMPFLGSDLLFS